VTKVTVKAGICGFTTTICASPVDDTTLELTLESDCAAVQRLAQKLKRVDAMQELTYRNNGSLVLEESRRCLMHPTCPVPTAILKAIEAAAGLALPADVEIRFATEHKA